MCTRIPPHTHTPTHSLWLLSNCLMANLPPLYTVHFYRIREPESTIIAVSTGCIEFSLPGKQPGGVQYDSCCWWRRAGQEHLEQVSYCSTLWIVTVSSLRATWRNIPGSKFSTMTITNVSEY